LCHQLSRLVADLNETVILLMYEGGTDER
jgi:hypothetical protein